MDVLVRGLSTTIIGLVVVIATLALIAFIISKVSQAVRAAEGKNQKSKEEIKVSESTPSLPAEENVSASESLTDDLELVAVISAAISAYTGMAPGRFKIFDIKPSESENWRQTNKNYN